jgi:hypothetical protein
MDFKVYHYRGLGFLDILGTSIDKAALLGVESLPFGTNAIGERPRCRAVFRIFLRFLRGSDLQCLRGGQKSARGPCQVPDKDGR